MTIALCFRNVQCGAVCLLSQLARSRKLRSYSLLRHSGLLPHTLCHYSPLTVHPEVKNALHRGEPVVALESTIISHGMPFPENVEMARGVEDIIRSNGATPATIAVLSGRPCIGLRDDQLKELARSGPAARKCSRRDLAVALSQSVDINSLPTHYVNEILPPFPPFRIDPSQDSTQGINGATTVAATAYLASLAGIQVFVTGGIGGVHRGAEVSMDISADLAELARTPVVVVCAGVKSILDIEKTLEVMETNGIPVISLGSKHFPAFFSPSSGLLSPLSLDTAAEVAAAAQAGFDLGMHNGMLVAVPNLVPAEGGEKVEEAIQQALKVAAGAGVEGRDVTPYVLAKVNEATGGASLKSNVALVHENARVGTEIALELAALKHRRQQQAVDSPYTSQSGRCSLNSGDGGSRHSSDALDIVKTIYGGEINDNCTHDIGSINMQGRGENGKGRGVAVFGGVVADTVVRPYTGTALTTGSSTPGTTRRGFGGVGRNVAEGVARVLGSSAQILGEGAREEGKRESSLCDVKLVSVVGRDAEGRALLAGCKAAGVVTEGTVEERGRGVNTASYVAVLDGDGDLSVAVADMGIFEEITEEFVDRHKTCIKEARVVVADGNIPIGGFRRLASLCLSLETPLIFEPTSVAKSSVAVSARAMAGITVATPNLDELVEMAASLTVGASRVGNPKECLEGQKLVNPRLLGNLLDTILAAMVFGNGEVTVPQPPLQSQVRVSAKHLVVTLGGAGVILASARPLSLCQGETSKPSAATNRLLGVPHSSESSNSSLHPLGKSTQYALTALHYPALPLREEEKKGDGGVVDCTGAGDCLAAGLVAGIAQGWEVPQAVLLGMLCASKSIQADSTVPSSLESILAGAPAAVTDPTLSDDPAVVSYLSSLLPVGYTPMVIDPWTD